MNRSSRVILAFTVAALVCAASPAVFAQQNPQNTGMMGYENPSDTGGQPSPEKQEQIRKRVETLRIWRLTETLKLDAETSAKLAAILSSSDRERSANFRERRETMRNLRAALTTRKPDNEKLTPLLEKLGANHRASQELIDKEWKGLQEILTPEQQARFVIFQQDFRRDIHRMIAGARDKGGMGRGQGKAPAAPQDK